MPLSVERFPQATRDTSKCEASGDEKQERTHHQLRARRAEINSSEFAEAEPDDRVLPTILADPLFHQDWPFRLGLSRPRRPR